MSAAKSGMARRRRGNPRLGKVPSEVSQERDYRTREDAFAKIWEEVRPKLELNSGLQAKTLFKDLQRRHPGKFQDGQLRTLQRRVDGVACELEGPPKELVLRAAARAWRALSIGLHVHERARGPDPRPSVRAPALSLCVDVLELGVGHGVFLGKLRELEHGFSKRRCGSSVAYRKLTARTD